MQNASAASPNSIHMGQEAKYFTNKLGFLMCEWHVLFLPFGGLF